MHDLFDTEGNFISYESIVNDYLVKLPFTTYEGLKQAIMYSWPNVKQLSCNKGIIVKPYQPEFIKVLCKNRKGSRNIYDYLMSKIQHRPICENKWTDDIKLEIDFNWKHMYTNFKYLTKDSGLIWFNHRIVHRILGTNKSLHMSKIKNSPLCSICEVEPETIKHLFFYCPQVSRIWLQLSDWIFQKSGERIIFDVKSVIFGFFEREYVAINLIILLVKKYLYQQCRKNNRIAFN